MASQAVQRISLRWLPEPAYEDTITIALNVGDYFIDLRITKQDPSIQWSRAGERVVLKKEPPTYRWTHIVDSLNLTIPDDAHFEKLPNGDDLEIGTTPCPHKGGVPTDYEEVWRDITAKKSADELSWILQSSDGTTFIGKVGGIFLAIRKTSHGDFAALREDRQDDNWATTYQSDGKAGLPQATQCIEAIEKTSQPTTLTTMSKKADCIQGADYPSTVDSNIPNDEKLGTTVLADNEEVFQQAEYRALGWIRTGVILMKLCFATGVLAIPSAFSVVGYGPGVILLACWGALTTYYAYIMYEFRTKYPRVHNIADAAGILGGPVARELAGAIFLLTWVLASGSGFIGLSQGFQVLSSRHVCTVVWTLVAAICTALVASIQTLGRLAILTWIGFASIFTAVFIVVVGVSQVERPAAAPQEGPFNLDVMAVGSPGFVAGLVATINLFAGYGSTPTFMPVIAEMRNPKSFKKALFTSQLFLSICYISFGVVVYKYCGQYVASPSLGSAGGTLEKIAYGISIPGFIMTSTLWVHLAAKFLLVRILRNSAHLQSNTIIHWVTWLGSTIGISAVAFIIAGAVPFFSYLIGLIGSLCCAPTCLILPALMGLHMDWVHRRSTKTKLAACCLHVFTVILGSFITVSGTYTTIQSIIDAYRSGAVGQAFTCS
ncbi:neutral amino acid transporter [Seiridium cupressi]